MDEQRRKPYDECIWKSCEQQEIEDLFNFIAVCHNVFSELREKALPLTSTEPCFIKNEQSE